jgi:hypothetical protein
LLAQALRITDGARLARLGRLVRLKAGDPLGYQRALLRFLGQA